MATQIPIKKIIIGNLLAGFIGAYVYGFLSTSSINTSFIYGLNGAVSLTLAEVSILNLENKILKSLTFGIVAGISASCLSFLLLRPSMSFLRFTIPLLIGCFVGGSIYIYLNTSLRSQN